MNNASHHTKQLTQFCLVAIFCLGLMFSHCARIVAPTGGPKDTIPPVLVNATPPDSTLHFHSQKIIFEFDEFIQLKNLRKQMIISPTPKKKPEISSKLEKLTIDWINKDSLTPNTTYIVNLGNAVTDLNEGNILKGFRYVFSTGDHLDSLEIHGQIIDARTGLPDSTALVMLYTQLQDSVVTQEKPLYYTRCKGDGSFLFQNLPVDTFKVFALIDGNGDLKYNGGDEKIAFLKNPISLDNSVSGIVLSLFHENEPKKEEKKEAKKKGNLTYSTSLKSKSQDLKKPLILSFNHPLKSLNEKGIRLEEDTTHQAVSFQIIKDTTFTKDIKVTVDSTMKKDTTILRDTAVNKVEIRYDWKAETAYRLLIDSAFAVDTLDSVYAKTDTIPFTTKAKSDYGKLILRFDSLPVHENPAVLPDTTIKNEKDSLLETKDSIPPNIKDSLTSDSTLIDSTFIAQADTLQKDSLETLTTPAEAETTSYQLLVELYDGKEMIYSAPLEGDTWEKGYLDPGEYNIRVVKDVNKNGKWDKGCYYCKEKRKPEKVFSFPDTYKVRANWDNENPAPQIKFKISRYK